MIRRFLSTLTAASVLWHAVVGCCAHHEHAHHAESSARGETEAGHESSHVAKHACGCSHHAERIADFAVTTDSCEVAEQAMVALVSEPSPHEAPCRGEKCSFVAVAIASAGDFLRVLAVVPALDAAIVSVSDAPEFADVASPVDDRAPPLRTHLALRVLLI